MDRLAATSGRYSRHDDIDDTHTHSRMSHTHDLHSPVGAIQNRYIAPNPSNYRGAFLLCVALTELNRLVVLMNINAEIDSVLAQSAREALMMILYLWVLRIVLK